MRFVIFMNLKRKLNSEQVALVFLCSLLLIFSTILSSTIIKVSDQDKSVEIIQNPISQTTNLKNASVYVNSSLYSSIQTEITQYIDDIESEGFNVNLYLWFDPSPTESFRAQTLRTHLNNSYNINNTVGAVLIGDFPIPRFDGLDIGGYYPNYPVDLFLMDLDGDWHDSEADGDYDVHSNGTGDMYPEIFVSRINPNATSLINQVQVLKDYLNRTHQYRLGNIARMDSGLMYIDDPWESFSHEWKKDFQYLYSNITLINNTNAITNASDYSSEIIKPYEFAHLFCHSDWDRHYFDAGTAAETQLFNTQVETMDTKSLFYNLYSCYACKYDEIDNLGSQYLFSSNYSLAIFGCSRSGGFSMNQYLYEPLSKNNTLGESFFNWWFNDILDPVVHTHGPDNPESRGNLLMGDPFLRIKNVTTASLPNMVPTIITASQTIDADNITLEWTSTVSTQYYNVYVEGVLNATSADTQEIIMLSTNGTYQIYVTSTDFAGMEYNPSNSITIIVAIEPTNNDGGGGNIPGYPSTLIFTLAILSVIYIIKRKDYL